MKITFILPCVGRKPGQSYPRSWLMEPLSIAMLSALTPAGVEKVFYDDRLEAIDYDAPTDLVAMSVETYTARRAYQISDRFRRKGVPVVMGGFHPSLVPEEVGRHADAVVVGEAEGVWHQLLDDLAAKRLQRRYKADSRPELAGLFPDRGIFAGRRYMDVALVETGRGCRLGCEFCSISAMFERTYSTRPVEDVVREIRELGKKNIFFVDDNLAVDRQRATALFRALAPLRIRWVGQIGVHAAEDAELLAAMRGSGCMGVLVGFEALQSGSRALSGKGLRGAPRSIYEEAISRFHRHGIAIYGTFVFGYETDEAESIKDASDFAERQKLFFSAFNHLVPFPGTVLYDRLRSEGRMISDDWWLDPHYRFGDVAFRPDRMTSQELSDACFNARRGFFSWRGILLRSFNWRSNCRDLFMTALYWVSNMRSRIEVGKRQGLPLGVEGRGSG